MKRKHYTEEQIIAILREHQAGASAPDPGRQHGVVENTIYRRKSKYGTMDVSEAKWQAQEFGSTHSVRVVDC